MKNKDLFGDDEAETKQSDFERLLDAHSSGAGRRLKVGDSFRAEILSIGKEEVFVSTGTPQDGVILRSDLTGSDGKLPYKVGDFIEVVVAKISGGNILLAKKGASTSAEMDSLEDAFDLQIPVDGQVLEAVKGGFRVKVLGQRAFCPISQIDLTFVSDPAPYVGKTLEFMVTKLEEGNIVLSRRKVLELQRAEHEGEFLKSVREGDTMEGRVVRLEPFGAFVEIAKNVEGLIHVSELSWSRVKHPEEVVSVGAQVRVKVLKVDAEGERLKISLSLKQGGAELDPWFGIEAKFPLGKILTGTIEKKEPYGYFVNIAPGVTGLLPKSTWRDLADGAAFENKKKGETLNVQIARVDPIERRISLAPPSEQMDNTWTEHAPTKKSLGTFGDLLKSTIQVKK